MSSFSVSDFPTVYIIPHWNICSGNVSSGMKQCHTSLEKPEIVSLVLKIVRKNTLQPLLTDKCVESLHIVMHFISLHWLGIRLGEIKHSIFSASSMIKHIWVCFCWWLCLLYLEFDWYALSNPAAAISFRSMSFGVHLTCMVDVHSSFIIKKCPIFYDFHCAYKFYGIHINRPAKYIFNYVIKEKPAKDQ